MKAGGRVYRILLLLFLVVVYIQGRFNFVQIDSYLHPSETSWLPFGREDGLLKQLTPEAKAAGLAEGDRLIQFDGGPVPGSASTMHAVAGHRVGDRVQVRVERSGQTIETAVTIPPFQTAPTSWSTWAFTLIVQLVTPWLCILLGFFVVFLRPRDRLAWMLLGLLLSFSQLAVGDAVVSWVARFDSESRSLSIGFNQLSIGLWPLFMMLFGIYFPDRVESQRWHKPLLRFIGIPVLLLACAVATISVAQAYDVNALPWLAAVLDKLQRYFWIISFPATGSFFANIATKAGQAKAPDIKRRLRLLYIGSTISLTPIFLVVLATVTRGKSFNTLPSWIWISALLLLLIFPLTLAYVIVVQRAMDVRMVIRQGLQYALATRAILVIRGIAVAAVFFGVLYAINDPSARRPQRVQWVAYGVIFVVLSGRIAGKLKTWVDKKFFREAVDAERILGELGEQVRTIVETKPLLQKVSETIASAMHVSHVTALLQQGGSLQPAYALGYGGDLPAVSFLSDGPTSTHLQKAREALRYYADDPESWAKTDPAMESERPKLDALDTQLLLPLRAGGKMLGILSLGPKRSEEPYTSTDVKLLETVALQTSLALENTRLTAAVASEVAQRERLNRELEIAREVQERLFPQSGPKTPGLDYAGKCRPAASIGGDYYDFFETQGEAGKPAKHLGIAIGDISGKGIPAALLMASLQASLRGLTIGVPSLLASLMENLNKLVFDTSPSNRYATFFYSQYDPVTCKLSFVNGGHNPPIVIHKSGDVERLEIGGPVVGLFGPAKYEQSEITLAAGDTIILFTDGVSEAMNNEDEEFGEDRLIATVLAHPDLPPKEVIEKILEACDVFADGAPQHDDMTALVIRVTGRAE